MITSFEVGAIFDIEDRASGTVAALAERVRGLTADLAAAKESLATFGTGDILSGVSKGFANLRDAIFNTKTATNDLGAAMGEMGASATRGATTATEAVNTIGTAVTRVTEQVLALRAEMGRPFEMAMSGGGGLSTTERGMAQSGYADFDYVTPPARLGGGGGSGGIYGEFEEVERQRLLGYAGGGGRGGRGGGGYNDGPGLGGGYGGSGLVPYDGVGGPPGGGIPLNYTPPPGLPQAPRLGAWELIEGIATGDAIHVAMEEDDAFTRAEAGLLLPTDRNTVAEQQNRARLRALARSSSIGTIYSEHATAMAMPTLGPETGFSGEGGLSQFEGIFRPALRSSEVMEREGLGTLKDNLTANMTYSHMTGRYTSDASQAGLDVMTNIALQGRLSPRAEEGILKYSVPIGMAAGIGADETARMTGYLQSRSGNSSTAGTGLSAMILGTMDTGGPLTAQHHARVARMERNELRDALSLSPEHQAATHADREARHGTKHQQALAALGITDASGRLTVLDDKGGLSLDKEIDDIYRYSQSHNKSDTLGALHDAFGVRGERQAEMFSTEDGIERWHKYRATQVARPGAVELQNTFSSTPLAGFEQGLARTGDLLNTLASATLPALTKAFEGYTSAVTGVNTHLQQHPDEAIAAAGGIGSMIGGQLLSAGSWLAGKAGMKGLPGAARLGQVLGLGAEAAPLGVAIGTGITVGGMLDDAVGWGVDGLFGKGTYEHYRQREAALLTNSAHGAEAGSGTTQHTSAIGLINRARPGTVPTSLPAAGSAGPVNNTQTINMGGVSVTVNAAPGTEGQAAGQSVVGALVSHLRNFLTHSSGPGEGTTSAPASVGGHS